MSSNRELLESLSRLKTERDGLRAKERENQLQRDQAKLMVTQMGERELEKRRRLKENCDERVRQITEELESEKENRRRVTTTEANFQRTLREKNQQINIFQEDKRGLCEEVESLKNAKKDFQQSHKELSTLRVSNKVLTDKNRKLELTISRLHNEAEENDEHQSAAALAEIRAKKLECDMTQIRHENDKLKVQIERTRDEYQSIMQRERENYQQSDSTMTQKHRVEISRLKSQLEEATQDLVELQTNTKSSTRQFDQEAAKVNSLTKEISQYRVAEAKLKTELRQLQNEFYQVESTLSAEKNRLQTQLDVGVLAQETKLSEVATLKGIIKSTVAERDDLLVELNDVKRAEIRMRSELELCKQSEVQSLAGEKLRLQELELDNRNLTANIASVNGQLTQKSTQLYTVQTENSNHLNHISDMERKLRELKVQLHQTRDDENEQVEMLEAEKENLLAELERKEQERIASDHAELKARTELNQIQSQFDLVTVQAEENGDEVDSLKQQLAEVEAERDDLIIQMSELESADRKGTANVIQVERELTEIQQKYDEDRETWTDRNNQLETELAEICEQLDHVKTEKSEGREIQSDMAQQLCNKQSEMELLSERHEQQEEDLKTLVKELEDERTALNDVVQNLEDEVEERDEKLHSLEQQIDELERQKVETETVLIDEKARTTQYEAALAVRATHADDRLGHIQKLEDELDKVEAEKDRTIEKLRQENDLVKQQKKEISAKYKRLKQENDNFKAAGDEISESIDTKDQRIAELTRKLSNERNRRAETEHELEQVQDTHVDNIRNLKFEKTNAMDAFKETEKMRKENDELNGQIVAEREKNNHLKHENEAHKIDQTRGRETMHQQANLIEFLQRQNQDLTPKKKKGKVKASPHHFQPPPLYKDLERQIDALRSENAKLKSKMYGSNTALDKIEVKSRDPSPAKPARNIKKMDLKNLRKSAFNFSPFPASFVGLCSVSSLPIYVGDMIIKKDGLVAHSQYAKEFQNQLNKAHQKINRGNCRKSRTDSVNFKGKLMFLNDKKWETCTAELDGSILTLVNRAVEKSINLDDNWALHGAVLFDNVHFMAQVDHEMCFALENVPESHYPGERAEYVYLCALSLPDKQSWFECIKTMLAVPKLAKNDNSKFEVSTVHKFSLNTAGAFPEVITSVALESIDTVLLGTKDMLLAIHQSKVIELAKMPIYKLVMFEDLIFAIAGSDRYPVYIYAKDILKAISTGSPLNQFHKIISKRSHVISAGSYQGKIGLAVASESVVRLFSFVKETALAPEYHVNEVIKSELCSHPSSLTFSTTSIICGTDSIVEVDFISGNQEPYLAEAEIRKTHQEKPIAMFTLYDSGKERHLICGQHGGYLVDNCGRVVQRLSWSSLPLGFEFSSPFLFVSHFYGIELVRIGVGQISPPTLLSSYRPRLLGNVSGGKLIVLSRPHGEMRTSQAAIKILTGTEEIEFDEALSGPSSLASSGQAHYAVSVYRPPNPRNMEPESLTSQSSTICSNFSIY